MRALVMVRALDRTSQTLYARQCLDGFSDGQPQTLK